jgi:DNA-directed RNA polymerase specialized sigma24 family protein
MEQVAGIKVLDMSVAVSEHDFGDLLRPLIEPGFRLAFAMLHDPQAAEDVVQDASFTSVGRSTLRARPPKSS